MTEPTAEYVVELYELFARAGVEVWVDGGWCVDALLGHQTRPHADLDIALKHSDVPTIRGLLEARGYRDHPRDDARECNFVMRDAPGREIDFHSFELDADGANSFGVAYTAEHLTGTGHILGRRVKCISLEWSIRFHTGFRLRETDYRDVRALCERFDVDMPEEHRLYWRRRPAGPDVA